jgi:hypothetical protein
MSRNQWLLRYGRVNVWVGILSDQLLGPAVFFIVIILSGVRLSPLGTAATTGLSYHPQLIDAGDCGAIGGMKIGRRNRSTRRKPAPAPLCPPQIPHDLTWARTRAAAVGSQLLASWAMEGHICNGIRPRILNENVLSCVNSIFTTRAPLMDTKKIIFSRLALEEIFTRLFTYRYTWQHCEINWHYTYMIIINIWKGLVCFELHCIWVDYWSI